MSVRKVVATSYAGVVTDSTREGGHPPRPSKLQGLAWAGLPDHLECEHSLGASYVGYVQCTITQTYYIQKDDYNFLLF